MQGVLEGVTGQPGFCIGSPQPQLLIPAPRQRVRMSPCRTEPGRLRPVLGFLHWLMIVWGHAAEVLFVRPPGPQGGLAYLLFTEHLPLPSSHKLRTSKNLPVTMVGIYVSPRACFPERLNSNGACGRFAVTLLGHNKVRYILMVFTPSALGFIDKRYLSNC